MDNSIYDKIVQLPLFLGMSREEISLAVGQARFGFHKHPAKHTILTEGQPCYTLLLLVDGTIHVHAQSDDHGYTLTEELHAPTIIQPEHLFGLSQRFSRTVTAKTACHLITLDKSEVMKLTGSHAIIHYNLLNIISAQAQKLQRQLWHNSPTTLEQRIVQFIAHRSIRQAGPKSLSIKMTRLANELNDSRLDISRALNRIQQHKLLTLHRGRIEIPAFEQLLQFSF